MTFDQYQTLAWGTALPSSQNLGYMVCEIGGEAGELVGKYAKYIRDGEWDVALVKKEMGDILWGLACLATLMGEDLDKIAGTNLEKLKSRKERGVLQGNGDTR